MVHGQYIATIAIWVYLLYKKVNVTSSVLVSEHPFGCLSCMCLCLCAL